MTRSAERLTPPAPPDPFRYGWRFVKKLQANGDVALVQVPLTLEDVLHPQEDDVIPQRNQQHLDAAYLEEVFRARLEALPNGFLLADCLVNWGVGGIRNHSPDLVVFQDVTNSPPRDFGVFHLALSGGRCVLAVEIVSPHTRENDVVHKLREYHQVGVPLYVLIDQKTEENGPRNLLGYRWTKSRYVKCRLDRQGRLLLKPIGVWLALEDERAVCYDAVTNERIGTYSDVEEARRAAEQRVDVESAARQAAEQRVRELEAALARLQAQRGR